MTQPMPESSETLPTRDAVEVSKKDEEEIDHDQEAVKQHLAMVNMKRINMNESEKEEKEENSAAKAVYNKEESSEWVVEDPRMPWKKIRRRYTKKDTLGNSSSCCWNRCVFTGDSWKSIFLVMAVAGPSAIFLTSVVPSQEWWSFMIVSLLVAGALLCNYFAVSIDPGIIPPAGPEMWNRPEEKVIINGKEHILKVCPTCYILKPPRSSHCPACDYCVEDYDHHCGVLGSCVAKRTFRFFAGFFIFCTLLAGYVFVRCVVRLAKWKVGQKLSESHYERWEIISAMGLCLYTCCLGCVCAGFAMGYIQMACKRTNQKQMWHHTYEKEENPLDTGNMCVNCCVTFFGPLGGSHLV